jgi:hypothetical protein
MRIRELGKIIHLPCEESSRLISESLDRPLTRSERIALRVHTFLCRGCRLVQQQLRALHAITGQMPDSARKQVGAALPRLSSDRKRCIKQLLAEAQQSQRG